MLSIAQLQKFNLENPPKVGLSRKIDVQRKYDKFLENPENTKRFVEKVKEDIVGKKYLLLENNFPYYVEEGIEHRVCWFTDSDPHEIIRELNTKMDVISCWRNIPANCSILAIKHLHVFVRV